MTKKLNVTNVRYFKTVKGMVGYECQTNVNGLSICNDGNGGATFLQGDWEDIKPFYHLDEFQLEMLINNYERLTDEV
tara:strand:+ start:539 stop:769 length:231 start_codon:yes stop_codon:yes gene_type:complete